MEARGVHFSRIQTLVSTVLSDTTLFLDTPVPLQLAMLTLWTSLLNPCLDRCLNMSMRQRDNDPKFPVIPSAAHTTWMLVHFVIAYPYF
jgi:hypothetical protein